jgi:hypothetical protein
MRRIGSCLAALSFFFFASSAAFDFSNETLCFFTSELALAARPPAKNGSAPLGMC